MKKSFIIFITLLLFTGCFPKGFTEQANKSFGDQHFKTAIALIELHNIRNNQYPEKLTDLKHVGSWDKAIFHSVEYNKLEVGYELNLIKGWSGKPKELSYPDDFWIGLGLQKSNLK